MEKLLIQNKACLCNMHYTFMTHFQSFGLMKTSRRLEKEEQCESIPLPKRDKIFCVHGFLL